MDGAGNTVMGGTWALRKRADQWDGSWRAEVTGSTVSYMGTWASSVKKPGKSGLREMLEAAIAETVSGTWAAAGGRTGAWSIRAVRK
jgi:hypothetical protein